MKRQIERIGVQLYLGRPGKPRNTKLAVFKSSDEITVTLNTKIKKPKAIAICMSPTEAMRLIKELAAAIIE